VPDLNLLAKEEKLEIIDGIKKAFRDVEFIGRFLDTAPNHASRHSIGTRIRMVCAFHASPLKSPFPPCLSLAG